jgi:hypothetical protein
MTYTYHPDGTIPSSPKEYVFVFGSNTRGFHGKGAALVARNVFGAEYGVGIGITGRSYAIPTKDGSLQTLDINTINKYIHQFIEYTLNHPDIKFWVTGVGCGLAGYQAHQIAPLFKGCSSNCSFPEPWMEYLEVKKLYAGIGSRRTPETILATMERLGTLLATQGYTVRSGAADGADMAFEKGAVAANGSTEIWLPWKGFNKHTDTGLYPEQIHYNLASTIHPAWDYLSQGPRALHARNTGQVLGKDLQTPVQFVLCYTPDGAESERKISKNTGGTGTAIRVADRFNIPVINMYNDNWLERLKEFVKKA